MLMTAQDFLDSELTAAAKSTQAHNNKWFEQIDDPSLCGWIASIVAKVLEEAAKKLSSWPGHAYEFKNKAFVKTGLIDAAANAKVIQLLEALGFSVEPYQYTCDDPWNYGDVIVGLRIDWDHPRPIDESAVEFLQLLQ